MTGVHRRWSDTMWKDAKVSVQAKRIGTRAQVERALDAIVAQAGGEVALAAMNLTTGEEIARNAERSMPTASVFKLPVAGRGVPAGGSGRSRSR